MVGMASTGVNEAKDRIKTAARNQKLPWPKTKVIVSLVPGDLPKHGTHFDLAIAVGIIAAEQRLSPVIDLDSIVFMGEVGLDGKLHGVPGALAACVHAHAQHCRAVVVPQANETDVAGFHGVDIRLAPDLASVIRWLSGTEELPTPGQQQRLQIVRTEALDMNQISGQAEAKHAAEVAAAGGHHVFFIGPRGSGKSMIAARLPTIMAPLTEQQQLETAIIHQSIAWGTHSLSEMAPFVAPHHRLSEAALIGGGSGKAKPGAVSLAHHGVLFLDEVTQIPARVLDALRIPLEQREVRLQRQHRCIVFPANFLLVLAANPCRCEASDPSQCQCSPRERQNHFANISGPLRDRIDIFATTYPRGTLGTDEEIESSATIAQRAAAARDRARVRWQNAGQETVLNAEISPSFLRRHFPPNDEGLALIGHYLAQGTVTQRGVDRAIKLAWTLADLEDCAIPTLDHVYRALQLRTANTNSGEA